MTSIEGAISWVTLDDTLGASEHTVPTAPACRKAAHKQIIEAYVGGLTPHKDAPYSKRAKSTTADADAPAPASVRYYHGNEPASKADEEQLHPAAHGFFEACHRAWAHHGSLVLSPDDVWLAIQAIFARYMRANAESLRDMFVSHAGQKELVVDMTSSPTEDWPLFIARAVQNVAADSKVDVVGTFMPEFTSSRVFDATMKAFAVMDHTKQYYAHTYMTQCGIRRVGLLGTAADWEKLRDHIHKLRAFAVPPHLWDRFFEGGRTYVSWIDDLVYIANRLILTHQGKPDVAWWSRILNKHTTQGSGSGTYVGGWLMALVSKHPADGSQMNIQGIKSLRFSVPVKRDDDGRVSHMQIIGGFTGAIHNTTEDSWRPQRSIAVFDVSSPGKADV